MTGETENGKSINVSNKLLPRNSNFAIDQEAATPKIKLEGWSGSFPTAAHQFDRKHREKLAAELKENS